MDNLKLRILEKLLAHLEEGDADDMRSQMKPKGMGVEVTEIGMKPKEPMVEIPGGDGKSPMDKMLSESGEKPGGEMDPKGMDDDELTDDELEELLKEHMS